MAARLRGACAAKLLDDSHLLCGEGRVPCNLFSLSGQDDTPPAAVDELAGEALLKRADAPADRGVLDADLPCRPEEGSRMRQRQEMPEVVPVYVCEFFPNHCATIGNFHT